MRAVAALVATCLVLVAGCGGGDETPELTGASAAAVEQINAACERWNAVADARGEFPLPDFDAENPSAEDLPIVANYFAATHPARDEMIATISQLVVPPTIQAEFDDLVTALARGQISAREQVAAARVGDVDGFVATLDEADTSQQAIDDAADDLGATECRA
jgi:hypothetical protein